MGELIPVSGPLTPTCVQSAHLLFPIKVNINKNQSSKNKTLFFQLEDSKIHSSFTQSETMRQGELEAIKKHLMLENTSGSGGFCRNNSTLLQECKSSLCKKGRDEHSDQLRDTKLSVSYQATLPPPRTAHDPKSTSTGDPHGTQSTEGTEIAAGLDE